MAEKLAKAFRIKSLGAGKPVTDEQLAKINEFALVPLTADQVYVRSYLMAHNGIDRDNERFSEEVLQSFKDSMPGKGFFVEGHPGGWSGKGGPGEGLFFDARIDSMSAEAFKALTGEAIKLPDGKVDAQTLFGDSYILRLPENESTLKKIDAGVYPFTSIGFNAKLNSVTDERGNYIYGEYQGKGETLEGSIVWLGAQPGAGAMKSASADIQQQEPTKGESKTMKQLIEKLSKAFKKTFTEETIAEELIALVVEKDAEISRLTPKAMDGEAFRKNLVEDVVRFGALIGEIPTDAEKQKTKKDFISTWPIAELQDFRERYEKSARTKFPEKFTIDSKDQTNKDQKNADADKNHQDTKPGRKDMTDPKHNELFATVGK